MEQPNEAADILVKYMYSAVLAGRRYINNPTKENAELADIAAEKARFAEHRFNVANEQGDYLEVPKELRQKFVIAADSFLHNATEDNRTKAENGWQAINSSLFIGMRKGGISLSPKLKKKIDPSTLS